MKTRRKVLAIPLACLALSVSICSEDRYASILTEQPETALHNRALKERSETPMEHDQRMRWFRDARFGMFVHWGLYAQIGGVWEGKPANCNACAEHAMYGARIPIATYAAIAKDFNPIKYNSEEWVLAAKNAGMKYIVITAKHGEGFAMFKSKACAYNIVDATPYKKDPIKDLVESCRKHDLKIGFYYSHNIDWYHPGGGDNHWDPAAKGDPAKYCAEIVIPQITELLSNYGKIDMFWFDTGGGVINKERADQIWKTCLSLQPQIIINNRLGGGYNGDTQTPEQHVPAGGFPGKDWEVCMTMNRTWGYSSIDHNWKSSEVLLHNLCDIASKGGNFLLNVGPNGLGEIPAPSLERMAEIGNWVKVNAEAIYGTRASIFHDSPAWGRVTIRRLANGDSRLYAMVFQTPANSTISLSGLTNEISKIEILGDSGIPQISGETPRRQIVLPELPKDRKNYVIALTLKGIASLDNSVYPGDQGVYTLTPRSAKISGCLKLQIPSSAGLQTNGEENIGCWNNKGVSPSWDIKASGSGRFKVTARLSSPKGGSVIEFVLGSQALNFSVPATGDWNKYKDHVIGELECPEGASQLLINAKEIRDDGPCNIAKITLEPLKVP